MIKAWWWPVVKVWGAREGKDSADVQIRTMLQIQVANSVTILKPFTHHMPRGFLWWDQQFADQIFRPCSIERHAAAEPTQCPRILAVWCNFCARSCCPVPLFAARHSVDVPLEFYLIAHAHLTTCSHTNSFTHIWYPERWRSSLRSCLTLIS